MITTSCEGCYFLQNNDRGKGCVLNQVCVLKDNKVITPGYCRMCRSHNWAKKQGTNNLQQLKIAVLEERAIKFDMLIFFDEAINCIEELKYTLNSDWYKDYVEKIIIVDVTGFGDRKNLALQYIKDTKHSIPIRIDSSVLYEPVSEREAALLRISKQVSARFFFAIPAGYKPLNFDKFASWVQNISSRVIHWHFPAKAGETTLIPYKLQYGLFITKPYKSLMRLPEKESFTERLRFEEIETEMGLSWLCSHC